MRISTLFMIRIEYFSEYEIQRIRHRQPHGIGNLHLDLRRKHLLGYRL